MTLKPVDHQNILIRLLACTSLCGPKHLTALAHSYDLPVSLHEVRVACDALVEQELASRRAGGYRLTEWGEWVLRAVPLLESYYTTPTRLEAEAMQGGATCR